MSAEAIAAIRAVRLASHQLANVCAAITGGTEMALSKPTVPVLGQDVRGLSPKPLGGRK